MKKSYLLDQSITTQPEKLGLLEKLKGVDTSAHTFLGIWG